jgi:riboflavin synthase
MFDGIIIYIGSVVKLFKTKNNEITLKIKHNEPIEGIKLGSSISCSGVCLTITEIYDDNSFSVYVSPETFERTNLKHLKEGDSINLGTPLKIGGTLDGHFVQGHVDDALKICDIQKIGDSHQIKIEMKNHLKKYITFKGSIAIDGVSLTVNKVDVDSFYVNIIPYTFHNTTFQYNKIGDYVNVEVDLIARYIESLMMK